MKKMTQEHEDRDAREHDEGGDEQLPGHVPIRIVSQRTGVNPVTLRAWERRYGLVRPHRTPKGHRLYSEDEIGRIATIVGWLDRGVSIGQVRGLLDRAPADTGELQAPAEDDWERFRARLLAAVDAFDENRLDEGMNEATSLYPFLTVHERLVLPLRRTLGRTQEQRGPVTPGDCAARAFFEGYLRRKLAARTLLGARHVGGPRVLFATLDDAGDGIGMLTLAAAMIALEWQPLVVPGAVPLSELPVVLGRRPAVAVLLYGESAREAGFPRALTALVQNSGVPVAVIGDSARIHEAQIRDAGGHALADESLATSLRRFGEWLP